MMLIWAVIKRTDWPIEIDDHNNFVRFSTIETRSEREADQLYDEDDKDEVECYVDGRQHA